MIGQIFSMLFVGAIVAALFGATIAPEPYGHWLGENKTMLIGIALFCNMVSSQLLQTGAFEVIYDGKVVFSKLESNGVPQLQHLATLIAQAAAAQ